MRRQVIPTQLILHFTAYTSVLVRSLAWDFTTYSLQLNQYSTNFHVRSWYQPDALPPSHALCSVFRFECGHPVVFLLSFCTPLSEEPR
ncbi:hypothetical protein QBC45DRAFT_420346 [Copromyces sp. CBS 386.78]|nr:hypothetical protein QBC45DRAFT_420346 [Copromyces sp. CBS 386.78]